MVINTMMNSSLGISIRCKEVSSFVSLLGSCGTKFGLLWVLSIFIWGLIFEKRSLFSIPYFSIIEHGFTKTLYIFPICICPSLICPKIVGWHQKARIPSKYLNPCLSPLGCRLNDNPGRGSPLTIAISPPNIKVTTKIVLLRVLKFSELELQILYCRFTS